MFEINNFKMQYEGIFFEDFNLLVENNNIYFVLSKNEMYINILFDVLQGFRKEESGTITFPDETINDPHKRPFSMVDRLQKIANFDTELTLRDFMDFSSKIRGNLKDKVLEILLHFDLFEKDLNQKIKNCDPIDFKAVYLALCLANNHTNIVINDFIRGEDKDFELKFNRLLEDLKKEGKAILYLSTDIFYAYQVADRVSFIKHGLVMPDTPIISDDLEEMDIMTLYKKYLS